MPIPQLAKRILIAAGVVSGAAVAVDVGRYLIDKQVNDEGAPQGTVTAWFMANRHVIGFALSHVLEPGKVREGQSSRLDAISAERHIFFHGKQRAGSDGASDAFRHTYAGALMTYRLIHNHGMGADRAANFVRDGGKANEMDSYVTGPRHDYARAMDEHNNDIGIALGQKLATQSSKAASPHLEIELQRAVLDGIAAGASWVLTDNRGVPRPGTPADIADAVRP